MTASPSATTRDDRVLPLTRIVAYVIVPFLVVAFAVLYPVPTDTAHLFAWHIVPTLTPMILARRTWAEPISSFASGEPRPGPP
jgi:hypothetical protein